MKRVEKKTSRAERKARRPDEILAAAFEQFAAEGYAATRVEDIAARLGITKGTIYFYFPTKEVLFQETFRLDVIRGPFNRHRQPSWILRRPDTWPPADLL